MDVDAKHGLLRFFNELEDPRMDRTKLHSLGDILAITICAVICGADDWTEIEAFGKGKLKWLRTFLELPNGIPSHDTFGRVFSRLDPEQLERLWLPKIPSSLIRKDLRVSHSPARSAMMLPHRTQTEA